MCAAVTTAGLLAEKAAVEDPARHPPHLRRLDWFAELYESTGHVTPRMMMEVLAEREFIR